QVAVDPVGRCRRAAIGWRRGRRVVGALVDVGGLGRHDDERRDQQAGAQERCLDDDQQAFEPAASLSCWPCAPDIADASPGRGSPAHAVYLPRRAMTSSLKRCEPRAPPRRSRLEEMSAGTTLELDPASRTRAQAAVAAHGQPHSAVPEAVAETPVTRWILSPRGRPLVLCRSTVELTSSAIRISENGGTKVPSQGCYKLL